MNNLQKLLVLLILPLMSIFVSCNKEEDPYFKVSESNVVMPYYGGSYQLYIETNAQWYLYEQKTSVDGYYPIGLSLYQGTEEDNLINFYAEENMTSQDVVQKFVFDASIDDNYVSQTVTVTLKGNPNVDDDSPNEGNDNSDSGSGGNSGSSGGGTSESKPSAPQITKAEYEGNSNKITWDEVSNATSYNVYRSTDSSTGYSKIGSTENNFYSDSNPKDGKNYYKVTAVNRAGESSMSANTAVFDNSGSSGSGSGGSSGSSGSGSGGSSGSSGSGSGGGSSVSKPSTPTNVNAENYGNSYSPEIKITWNEVANATSYNVYRSTSSSSGYSKIGSTTNTYYSDFNPKSGKNYYKVTAVNSAGESSTSSYAMYDNDPSKSAVPATPNVTVSGSSSSLRVSWSCNTGGNYGTPQKYEVHKRDPSTASYTLLTTTTSTSYTDSNPHPGINRYAIVAINSVGKSAAGQGYSDSVPLANPTSFSASKSGSYVSFSWSKAKNASGYQIFVSSSASSGYTILEEISGGSSTSKSVYYPASSGSKMYFKIRAYWEEEYGGSRIYSDYSSYKSVSF